MAEHPEVTIGARLGASRIIHASMVVSIVIHALMVHTLFS